MKKVIILAYDFPPYVSVGGLRPYNWYQSLKEFGVEPIVVTRQWHNQYQDERDYIAPSPKKEVVLDETDSGVIIAAPHFPTLANRLLLKYGKSKFRLLRKIITAYYEYSQFFFHVGSKKELLKAADDYLKENKVDAIIASGEPFILFHYAKKLSRKYNIPWIADYRDPWSQNEGRQQNRIFSIWNEYIERKTIRSVSCITTVSAFVQKTIEKNAPKVPFYLLPNGYNSEAISSIQGIKQDQDTLKIAFVGRIYDWHPWKSFIDEFSKWFSLHDSAKIELHFYGVNNSEEIITYAQSQHHELVNNIVIHPRIPNEELLIHMAKSNVMLLFNYYSYMGTKIYDYIGVRRKIILCFENDSAALELKKKHYHIREIEGMSQRLQAEVLEETNGGIVVQQAKDLQQIFTDLWSEFQSTGQIKCDSIHVEQFSRKIQVGKLAQIISDLKKPSYE